ncbi:M20 family metallopeptidase [Acidobacteriota bacterium]
MIDLLKKIVALESPSSDKEAVDRCSSYVIKEIKKTGSKITRFPQKKIGDLYLSEYAPTRESGKKGQILILVHLDTVWPVGRIQKMPFYISGTKIYGPGVLDMKSGVVMAIYALKTLKQLNFCPKKKIAVFFNSAEEIGSKDAYEKIEALAKKSTYILCLEPALPGGALKIQRKGRMVVRLKTEGKAAHGGSPDIGISAIEELMHQLRFLKKIESAGTTLNIGLIEGGEKINIVADKASATLDIRFWKTSQKEKIMSILKQLNPKFPGARISHVVESFTPPMEKTGVSSRLFLRVQKIGSTMNLALTGGKTGGGSDASIVSNLGLPVLDGLGPDGDGIHAENEHLSLPSLIERTALLVEILKQL